MRREYLAHDRAIRRAGERNGREIVIHAKALLERMPQGVFSGASGEKEGSINVEEKEFFILHYTNSTREAARHQSAPLREIKIARAAACVKPTRYAR